MSDLAIVIVSYNACADLEACLDALAVHPPATPHEIVVVDNASADGSAQVARARWPHITVIDAGGNLGFARATNLGIRATVSPLLLLLNSDTVPSRGSIDGLVAILQSRPNVAIVGPRLVNAEGVLEVSFGLMISPFAELWQKCLVAGQARRTPLVARLVERRAGTERVVDWVSGACLLVRRGEAETAGLLDERYFLYLEDVDFCAAVRGLGRHVLYTPSVEIVHHRGRSRQAAPVSAMTAYRRSQLAFYQKHHPRWHPILRAYLRMNSKLFPDA